MKLNRLLMKDRCWLVALLLGSAVGAYWLSTRQEQLSLELSLRPNPTTEQRYKLQVHQVGNNLHYVFLHKNSEVSGGQLAVSESRELLDRLREAHAWELSNEETNGTKADFYAEFTIDGHHSSCNGLTRDHSRVIQALMDTPPLCSGLVKAFDWCGAAGSQGQVTPPNHLK